MSDLMEQNNVVHNGVKMLVDENILVAFNDYIRAFLTGEITGHNDQPQLPRNPVSVPCAALPHNTVGLLNGFLGSNQHSGITPSGQNGTVSV